MQKHPHILNAASNLLGIAFVLIAGLHITRASVRGFADEIAWVAAVLLCLSCILSYVAIRSEPEPTKAEAWADRVFLAGLVALFTSVVVLAFTSL